MEEQTIMAALSGMRIGGTVKNVLLPSTVANLSEPTVVINSKLESYCLLLAKR